MISIVMPVCNTPAIYLHEAIDSVLNQSLQDYELIIVNDTSDRDDTIELLNSICENSKIRYVRNTEKLGAGQSRNVGLGIAKGEYIIFLDSDDVFDTRLLEELYVEAKGNDLDVTICSYEILSDNVIEPRAGYWDRITIDKNNELRLLTIPVAPWTKLYKKEYLQRINALYQDIDSCNDVGFFCYTMLCTENIGVLYDRVLVKYRIDTSFQISSRRNPINAWKAVLYAKNKLIQNGVYSNSHEISLDAFLLVIGVSELQAANNNADARKFYDLLQSYYRIKRYDYSDMRLHYLYNKFKEQSYESQWFAANKDYEDQLEVCGKELLKRIRIYNGKIYVWGMGKRGCAFLKWIERDDIFISGICDNKNNSIGKKIYGVDVVSTEKSINDANMIIATNVRIYDYLTGKTNAEIVDLEKYCPL